ncbi:uncharacterized protein [Arachis hypogaea]|uniref:uncharacterized protein n=1 Tax=Arachis hypogaea TaxID=3818 RepID=UPI003B21764B
MSRFFGDPRGTGDSLVQLLTTRIHHGLCEYLLEVSRIVQHPNCQSRAPDQPIGGDPMHRKTHEKVIARFGISKVMVSNNGTQFSDKKFGEFLSGLGIKQKFSSVEHPRNKQAEATNKIILNGLKKLLDQRKGSWADELASVFWCYRTTPKSSTEETPFRIIYRVDAVIPIEIGEPSPRLLLG